MPSPLKELLRDISPRVSGSLDIEARGLCLDSRRAAPGDVFFALPGARTDGNRHVKEALKRGVVAIVSELAAPPAPVSLNAAWIQVPDAALAMGRVADRFFGRPSRAMTIFGVTGTNGKTTTSYFLESIVSACGGVPAVIGTVDYRLAGQVLEKAPNTTPVSLDLSRLLARFRDGGATHVAMEVSSHALALKRVDEVDFDAAIFTNLSRDHLDFHKTPEAYFQAKARLFELLVKTSSTKRRKVAAINADDPRAESLRRRADGAETVFFGLGPEATLAARDLRLTVDGSEFSLSWRGRKVAARIRLAGEHNVLNALAAAAAALGLGMPEEGVRLGLENLRCVPGRLERVEAGQDFSAFVDYAHTDIALRTILSYLAKIPHRRLITVFGCGGDRDRGKRVPMGEAACRLSDLAVVTTDNPRTEDPAAIIAQIENGLRAEGLKNYKIQPDRREAIRLAVSEARAGDIVVVAGKGHEDYQILKDETIHFDDREEIRAAIAMRGPGR